MAASRTGPPRIALVGRPNVGKSSLFNRLLGRREAIVHDRPGVTRDRLERATVLEGRALRLLDTGGLVPDAEENLLQTITHQALHAVAQAQLILFVIDGRSGVTPLDESVAGLLRDAGVPVVLVANKIDVPALEPHGAEGWRLGLGEPFAVSAEHNLGMERLVDQILALLPPPAEGEPASEDGGGDSLPAPEEELHLAIVGRPNVGKSSLVNRLAGEERVTVSSVPGTTRDAIDVLIRREGRTFRLVDTAGLRKRSRVSDRDEAVGILFGRRRLERCHVAVLVLDATAGPTSQDVGIAGEISRAGRPLVLALNKWDLVEDPEEAFRSLESELSRRLSFVSFAPRVTLSAVTGQRAVKVLDAAAAVAQAACRRVRTSELNRFLERTLSGHIAEGGSAPKMLYMTQTGVLPPRFVLFYRERSKVPPQLRRFLETRLRDTFDFGPTPVMIDFRPAPRRRPTA